VAEKLSDVGIEPTLLESAPGRSSVIARLPGADPSRPAMLVHGHLDVVPAVAADWQVPPFAGEIRDDYLWGRGAVDMKDMVAMTLATVRELAGSGRKPPRDLILAFVADEEAGGVQGAQWLVRHHPELFEGATDCVSEVGGFSYTVSDSRRLYLIETAQKGIAWLRLTVRGRAGHGSFLNDDNAVTLLAEAVARVGRHTFPTELIPTVRRLLAELADALGMEFDEEHPELLLDKLGSLARIIGATLRHTVNPTMLQAGYKANVIPATASAYVDGRFLPGRDEEFFRVLGELIGPDVEIERIHHDIGLETSFDGDLVDAMTAALRAEDPGAHAVPYCLSGGTDGKSFARLGMRVFGFSPLRLPADLDFAELFHGVDERVPVDGLLFGTRVLRRFLASC
jgi:acetylornithine deacetylase/succinyl-diaminopimelate desuccinylase-like protein